MMAYKELKNALIEKLGISPQAIYQQAEKIKRLVPMTTKQAICIIAQRNDIKIDKYLDEEEIQITRDLLQHFTQPIQTNTKRLEERTEGKALRQNVITIGKQFKIIDPLLPRNKLNEANEMSDIFPCLYVLENSIRGFIDRIMTDKYGTNWWDSQAPSELQKDVTKRMSEDKRDSWHQRRGARPIDYIDLKDLPRLMNKLEKIIVPNIIPDLDWFRQLVKQVYKSRCVVCHMNPLDKDNADAVLMWFNQWEKQISAKKELIPNNSP